MNVQKTSVILTLALFSSTSFGREWVARQLTSNHQEGYPIAAFRDTNKQSVRLYGQYAANDFDSAAQHAKCHFANSTSQEEQNTKALVTLLHTGSQDATGYQNYFIECDNAPLWAETITVQLGAESIGKPVTIKDIGKTRIGKVAMCTQQLENFVPWLEDWVAYHMSMGVSQVHLFKGQGQHGNRKSSIPELRMSANPRPTQGPFQWAHGLTPEFSKLIIEEYEQAPTTKEQTQLLITSLCQYSLQHEFEYVIGQDHEEFLFLGKSPDTIDRSLLPQFLDKHVPQGSNGIILEEVHYPLECQTSLIGNHVDQYSLAYESSKGSKTILKVVEALKLQNAGETSSSSSSKVSRLPQSEGFIKLIQPASKMIDGKRRPPACVFGLEAKARNLEDRLIVSP